MQKHFEYRDLPSELSRLKNFLVWRLVAPKADARPGAKPAKIPYYITGPARGSDHGSDADRAQLCTYDEAVAAVNTGRYSGVGLAMLPDSGVVALDFDKCVVDGVPNPNVMTLCEGTYTEVSPSGKGIRAFMLGYLPTKRDNEAKRHNEDFDFEVYGSSGYVTITGNPEPTAELFGWCSQIIPLTPSVLGVFTARFGDPYAVAASGDDLQSLSATKGWSADQARAILADVPATTGYDNWLSTLMAIHHEFNGSLIGLNLVDEWSATAGPAYSGRASVEQKWNSFGTSSGLSKTGAWLLKWQHECNLPKRSLTRNNWQTKIDLAANEYELRETICPGIGQDKMLESLDRDALVAPLKARLQAMNMKISATQCRKLLDPPKAVRVANSEFPWTTNWYFVTEVDKFYKFDTEEWCSPMGFCAKYDHLLPDPLPGERDKSASRLALELGPGRGGVLAVTRGIYNPIARLPSGAVAPTFHLALTPMNAEKMVPVGLPGEEAGTLCVNTYRPSSVPNAADWITPAGQAVIDRICAHILTVAGGRKEVADVIISWLAHNVQKPGVKIRWAPLIKGVEGTGKSLFGKLLGAVMGDDHIKTISPTVLATNFTDWAQGACVGIFEEIKLDGHSRYDIMNRLKPYISDDKVEVHGKGKAAAGRERNVQNYIAFTNFDNALPLTDTDRRWFIVFMPFRNIGEFGAAVGMPESEYFTSLFDGVKSHGAELRRWLLDVVPVAAFEADGRAPLTTERDTMIENSVTPEMHAVKDALERGGIGISETVVSTSYLSQAMLAMGADSIPKTTALHRILKDHMGWVSFPKAVHWNGKLHRVMTKGVDASGDAHMAELVRNALNETLDVCKVSGHSHSDDLF